MQRIGVRMRGICVRMRGWGENAGDLGGNVGNGVGMRGIRVKMWGRGVGNISLVLRLSCNDPNQRYYLNGILTCGPIVLILFQ